MTAGEPLGQHFLRDEAAIARMVEAAELQPGDTALDVGAGQGAITRALAQAVQPKGKIIAIELDARLARDLRAAKLPGIEVVEGDLLHVPLPEVDAVVANPPFKLCSPLLFRLLDAGFGRAVLVLPRELAERILAKPRQERYGKLTIRLALACDARLLFPLPRRAFDPPPEVPASVLRFETRAPLKGVDVAVLDALLDAAWASKRRTLRHGLAPLALALRISSGTVSALLDEHGWSAATPDELSPEEYADLARKLTLEGKSVKRA